MFLNFYPVHLILSVIKTYQVRENRLILIRYYIMAVATSLSYNNVKIHREFHSRNG